MTLLPRDASEIDALVTDRYLEALLSAHDRGAESAPSPSELDPGVRRAGARLTRDLTRVHPSFRFEERLAGRLAEAASRMSMTSVQDRDTGTVAELVPGDPARRSPGPAGPIDVRGPLGDLDPRDLVDPARPEEPTGFQRRPLIIGGTLASAALSIAGAAIVAWRLSRPAGDPLRRGIRAGQDRVDGVRLA